MTAFDRIRAAATDHGFTVRDTGAGRAMLQCGSHDDRNPSVSLTRIETQALIYCHGGCGTEHVLAGYGLTMADAYDDRSCARYDYCDDRRVYRSASKKFRQENAEGCRALFRAERIGDRNPVLFTEGEKDVLAVEAAGGAAVCSAGGAGKAHRFDMSPLAGKDVIVVADKDGPGSKHARQVAELLDRIAASVRIVEAKVGKDFADHLAAGHGLDDLVDVDAAEGMPRLWRAIDLRGTQQPHWLAKNRLPRAAVSLLIGDEGIGKSLFWVWLVAAITTGKPLHQFGVPARPPAFVIVVCTEDDWSGTVRPRLEVAGADLAMIRVICIDDDGGGSPTFPRDLFLILEADPSPALVVVDAWLDTVPANLSVKDPQQARQALHPWKEVATATGAAMLLLTHTNRVASPNARDRYGITGELRKKARLTLYAQQDDDGYLLIGPEKANGAADVPASRFTINSEQFWEPSEDHDGTVPLLAYIGESDRTAREHVADSADDGADEPGGSPAKNFLHKYLLDQGGEATAADVIKAGRVAGFSEQDLKNARRRHRNPRIVSRKGSFGDGWVWAIDIDGPEGVKTPEGAEGVTQKDTDPTSTPSTPSAPWTTVTPSERSQADTEPDGFTSGSTPAASGAGGVAFTPPLWETVPGNGGLCQDCRSKPCSRGPRCENCHRTHINVVAGYDR